MTRRETKVKSRPPICARGASEEDIFKEMLEAVPSRGIDHNFLDEGFLRLISCIYKDE